MIKLDKIDYEILRLIQNDGRISNANLSDSIGLSPSPCLRRVRELEKKNVIKKYVGLIEPKAVGFLINAFVNVSLRSQEEKSLKVFEESIAIYDEVIECYLMTGSSDYLLRVVTRDLEDYERFVINKLTKIEGIANIQTSFALKPLIQRTEIPI